MILIRYERILVEEQWTEKSLKCLSLSPHNWHVATQHSAYSFLFSLRTQHQEKWMSTHCSWQGTNAALHNTKILSSLLTYNLMSHTFLPRRQLHMLNKLWIEEGETHELCLVQVHHEQFICGSKICLLRCELFVKVAHILAMFLK